MSENAYFADIWLGVFVICSIARFVYFVVGWISGGIAAGLMTCILDLRDRRCDISGSSAPMRPLPGV